MASYDDDTVTHLLAQLKGGNRAALDRLLPMVYDELRGVARRQLNREYRAEHTLDSVALINEVYLKMVRQDQATVANRAHFFALCANSMRQILVSHARRRKAAKRGGGLMPISLSRVAERLSDGSDDYILALNEALDRLATINQEAKDLVECRFFTGLTTEEAANALGLSYTTARRRWDFAKVWLARELRA